jgi:murein L,D-transpeptidase YafK
MGVRRLSIAAMAFALADPLGQVRAVTPVTPVDHIIVDKSDHELVAYFRGNVVRRFNIALGFGGLAPKTRQGDGRVPEGLYRIAAHNNRSAFYKSLRIGYPTEAQRRAARRGGYNPGGDIMVHGLPNGQAWIGAAHRMNDWTAGCIAMTNEEIDWLYARVKDGTPIGIRQ